MESLGALEAAWTLDFMPPEMGSTSPVAAKNLSCVDPRGPAVEDPALHAHADEYGEALRQEHIGAVVRRSPASAAPEQCPPRIGTGRVSFSMRPAARGGIGPWPPDCWRTGAGGGR